MEGWIKIWRKVRESDLWPKRRKFTPLEAWIDLLLSVNGEERMWQGITIPRGSFITSQLELSKQWRWSIGYVNKFLKQLQAQGRIVIQSTNKYTLICVTKYSEFNPLHENKVKPKRKQSETTNEGNEGNENSYIYTDESKELWVTLWKHIKINYPHTRDKTPEQHKANCAEIDKLLRIDKHSYSLIQDVIHWSQNDDFWRQNIKSGAKLREQFEKLLDRMTDEKRKDTKKDTQNKRNRILHVS